MRTLLTKPLVAAVACASLLGMGTAARATVQLIASDTSGAALSGDANEFGQEFVVSAAGPVNNVTFNFFSNVPPTTPIGGGTGYLFDLPYYGSSAALGSSDAGYLGQAVASGGYYSFDPGVVLIPGDEYYFYSNYEFPKNAISEGMYAPVTQSIWFLSDDINWQPEPGSVTISSNFAVKASLLVPEPPGLQTGLIGLAALAAVSLLRRRGLGWSAPYFSVR